MKNENEPRISVGEFRDKAREFFAIAKRDVELPFEEMFFVEVVSVAYEFLWRGKKIDGLKVKFVAAKNIISENEDLSWFKVFEKCGEVVDGFKDGKYFCWRHYCERYINRIYPDTRLKRRNDLDRMVEECDALLVTHIVENFAYVVFCCIV